MVVETWQRGGRNGFKCHRYTLDCHRARAISCSRRTSDNGSVLSNCPPLSRYPSCLQRSTSPIEIRYQQHRLYRYARVPWPARRRRNVRVPENSAAGLAVGEPTFTTRRGRIFHLGCCPARRRCPRQLRFRPEQERRRYMCCACLSVASVCVFFFV